MDINSTPHTKETIQALWRLEKIILDTRDFTQVVQKIVDGLLTELGYLNLGYKIIVLALVDEKEGVLKRISISQTDEARKALELASVPFRDIVIPLFASENIGIQVLGKNQMLHTQDWKDILTPTFSPEDARKIQTTVGINTSMVFPVTYQGKAQGVIIFSLSKKVEDVSEDERDLLGGFSDIVGLAVENARLFSELTNVTNQLQQANEKLKELDKRKDEFLSVAAHELRAPMTAIKGYLSMISEGDAGEMTTSMKDFVGEALSGNDRLIRLVNNMLNISRIEEGRLTYEMGNVNLKDVCSTVVNEYKIQAQEKKLELNYNQGENVSDLANVDRDRIYEVVSNLISNAIKYTDQGSVNVKIFNPNPKTVRVEVSDTGPGMNEADKTKLFQKFFRAESSEGKVMGTGLGLYISKLLIEKFGGMIGFESEMGKGSTFWFELPVVLG